MKRRNCGLVQRIGTADSATPHPDPSGGQAPSLHFLIPPSAIGLQFGTFRPWRAGIEVDWRATYRIGVRDVLSYESLMPAGAGTPRYENRGADWRSCVRRSFATHTPPLDSGLRRNDDWEGFAGALESRSRAFRTNRPCRLRPAHQGMKSRSCGLVQRIGTADSATPHPRPQRGTSPSPREVFDRATFSHSAIGLQFGTFRPVEEPASRLIGGHIPDRSPGHAFVPIGPCRLAPAHQGMKIEALEAFGCSLVPPPPPPLDSGLRRNDEWRGLLAALESRLRAFSYQSLMPGWRRHTKV